MRFVSFSLGGFHLYGLVEGDNLLLPDSAFAAAYPNLRSVIAGNALADFVVAPNSPALPLDGLAFDPVIPDPGKIICVGQNYRAHGDDGGLPAFPPLFIRLADTQIGHDAPLIMPVESEEFELEGELAMIIGRPGRAIAASAALDHVAGYCCYNDASAREWQRHSSQLTAGKNFPGTGACGPFLVTADEIEDPDNLRLVARVDGVTHQSANTADMLFGTRELIAYVSRFTPLAPGDIIVTGTPARTPAGQGPERHLQPGVVVEVEIEKVGLLRNRIVRADA